MREPYIAASTYLLRWREIGAGVEAAEDVGQADDGQ